MSKPVHIDEAIEVEQVALDYYSNLVDMEAEAETTGWVNALKAVRDGKVFNDDKLRADRMTRALAAVDDPIRRQYRGFRAVTFTLICRFCAVDVDTEDHADDCPWIEARRWVDANPEVGS